MTNVGLPELREEANQLAAIESWSENDPDAVARLIRAMGATSWRVRQAAVASLKRHSDRENVVGAVLRSMRQGHRDLSILNATIQFLAESGVDTFAALRGFLTDPDPELRGYAAIILGDQNNGQAIPDLVAILDDPAPNVRFNAIESLGKLKAGAATEKLATIAESRDFTLAFAALAALASIGDSHVWHRLVPFLDDEYLQTPALETLGRLGDEEAVSLLAARLNDPTAPVSTIAQALANIYERFEEIYREGDFVASLARTGITETGKNHLLDGLKRDNKEEIKASALVLGWLVGPDIDAALSLLLDEPAVRYLVADALVRRGSSVTALLIDRLVADGGETRRAAVLALGRLGDRHAVPALLSALRTDESLTIGIAGALAMIGDAQAYAPLIGMLGHSNAGVRQAVVSALNAIGHPDLAKDLLTLLRDPSALARESAVKIAGYFGFPECAELVLNCCLDDGENVRRAAVECLPHLEDKRSASALLAALHDKAASVRAVAARVSGQWENPDIWRGLQGALNDQDLWVRYFAARSAGRRGDAQGRTVLRKLAEEDNAMQVRVAAVEALGQIGDSADLPVLAFLAGSTHDDLSRVALTSLGLIAHPSVLPPLFAAVGSAEPRKRVYALQALGETKLPEATEKLRQAALDSDDVAAQAAIQALGRLATPRAVEALVEMTAFPHRRDACISALAGLDPKQLASVAFGMHHESPDVRRAVVIAFARMRNPAARPYLRIAAEDMDGSVRFAAIAALTHGSIGSRHAS